MRISYFKDLKEGDYFRLRTDSNRYFIKIKKFGEYHHAMVDFPYINFLIEKVFYDEQVVFIKEIHDN